MHNIVIFFLLVSVFLYCLLGGADFGAGIIELTARGEPPQVTQCYFRSCLATKTEPNVIADWFINYFPDSFLFNKNI